MVKNVNKISYYSTAYIVLPVFVISLKSLNGAVLAYIFDHMMVKKPYNLKVRVYWPKCKTEQNIWASYSILWETCSEPSINNPFGEVPFYVGLPCHWCGVVPGINSCWELEGWHGNSFFSGSYNGCV